MAPADVLRNDTVLLPELDVGDWVHCAGNRLIFHLELFYFKSLYHYVHAVSQHKGDSCNFKVLL